MTSLERELFKMILSPASYDPIPPEQIEKELTECIKAMHSASSAFYSMATRIQNHPFIEFTGLMNEYIKSCERAAKSGQDFRFASVHTEEGPLKLLPHEVKYIQEKLECIYGEQIFEKVE